MSPDFGLCSRPQACPTLAKKCAFPVCSPFERVRRSATVLQRYTRRACAAHAFPNDDLISGSFPFDLMDKQLREMERVEREMDATFERMAKETESLAKQAESQRGNVRVETREEKFANGYSYSRTVVITNDNAYLPHAPAPAQGLGIGAVGLLVGVLVGLLTYLFNKGFEVTTFRKDKKWLLLLTWPVLVLFSPSFRKQVKAAMKSGAKPLGD